MTAPTIPPQQPEPERVCGNCEFFQRLQDGTTYCELQVLLVSDGDTCNQFRARKES